MKRRTGIAITGEGTGRGTLKYWKPEWNREGLQQKCRELGFAVGGSREILLARLKDGGMELPDENEMRSTETSICLKQAAMKNSNDVVIEDNHAAGSIISEGVRRSARIMEGVWKEITRDELAMPLEQDGSLSLGGADSPSSSRGVALPPRIVKSREPVIKYRIHRKRGIGGHHPSVTVWCHIRDTCGQSRVVHLRASQEDLEAVVRTSMKTRLS